MYKEKNKKNAKKTTKTAASEIVVTRAGACKTRAVTGTSTYDARAIIRSPPTADNIRNHRSTPATTAHDK
jgi:hypothetical protein